MATTQATSQEVRHPRRREIFQPPEESFRSEAEVIIVAASRDQADILRRQAEQLVKRSGKQVWTFSWAIGDDVYDIKAGYREIRFGDGRMRVLAAEAATGDGTLPTLALVDELHRHRSMELYGLLADGLEAPAPNVPGAGGSLAGFERFCRKLRLENGKPLILEPHERAILRPYFRGVRETVVVLSKKNGKTTLLAALGLYHLKVGARVRQMMTISTAGLRADSPLGLLRERAHKLRTFKRVGMRNTASEDGFEWIEWCLTDTDDQSDIRKVKRANPASWHTMASLKRRFESPSMTPGRWARFACGVWTGGEEPWLEAPKWDRLKVDIGRVQEGEPVWAAVVTGTNPAIALAAPRPDEGMAVRVELFEGAVKAETIEDRLVELAGLFGIRQVAFDQLGFQRSAELLEKRGLPMIPIPHSPERLSIMSETLHRLIEAKKLRHDGSPELRLQVLAGSTKETERGWRLVISNETRALIAMAVAVHQASHVEAVSEPLFAWT